MPMNKKIKSLKRSFLVACGLEDDPAVYGDRLVSSAEMNKFYDVQDLLENRGVPVNSVDRDGYTAMHKACDRGLEVVADAIKPFKPDTTIQTRDGFTPWHMAAFCTFTGDGQISILRSFKPSAEELNIKNVQGKTMLHIAARTATPEFLDIALNLGADPTIKDNDGRTPLDVARDNGRDADIIAKLEKAPAARTVRTRFRDTTAADVADKKGHGTLSKPIRNHKS